MDWNEDGLKDLIVGEYNGQVRYYRNVGTPGNPSLTYQGPLMVGSTPIDIGSYSHPWVDDWNEDGRKDLLVGASDGRIWMYINVGTNENPVFNTTQYVRLASGSQLDFGSRSGPMVADFNGDGLKDLASGDYSGRIYCCLNNGTNPNPQLANPVALRTGTIDINPGGTSRAAPVDWDQDGDWDLMAGSYDARLKLYLQVPTTAPAPVADLVRTSSYSIPPSGGTVTYTFEVDNQTSSMVTFDVWTEVQLPNDNFFGPILSRDDLSIEPYATISRSLNQAVPGSAPAGYYYYYGYVGDQSELQVYSSDYFYFYKTGLDGVAGFGGWDCTGWEDDYLSQHVLQLPERMSLHISPNPFNPLTTLSFDLPEAGQVHMSIFNLAGQRVAQLVDGYREAGRHEITWDASGLPSGVYLVTLGTEDSHVVQKIFLLK